MHYVGGDPAASDLRRILRVPGCANRKPKYAPNYPLVHFLWCDLDCRYSVAELDALLPAETPKAKAQRIHIPAHVQLKPVAPFTLPKHPTIEAYNKATDIHDQLLDLGYTDAGDKRMSRPGADSAGLELNTDNTATIYSTADPLFCGHRVTPAHVLCTYTHGGDVVGMLAAMLAAMPDIKARYEAIANMHAAMEHAAEALPILRAELDAAGLSPRGAMTAHRVMLELTRLARANASYELHTQKEISTRRLAEKCATSNASVKNALDRLEAIGWLSRTVGDDGMVSIVLAESTNLTVVAVKREGVKFADSWLSGTNGDDFYAATPSLLSALKRRTDQAIAPIAKALEAETITPDQAIAESGIVQSAGPAARYLVNALQIGPLTGKEAAALSGLTRSSCYTAARKLHDLGLVEVDSQRRLALVGDFQAKIDAIRPKTRTFGNTQRRLELHSRERMGHITRELANADQADRRRIMRLEAARDRHLKVSTEIRTWLELAGLKPAPGAPWELMRHNRQQARDKIDATVGLAQLVRDFRQIRQDKPADWRHEAQRLATIAGWAAHEISQAMSAA